MSGGGHVLADSEGEEGFIKAVGYLSEVLIEEKAGKPWWF